MKKNALVGMASIAALAGAAVVMGQQGTQPGSRQPGQTPPSLPDRPGQLDRPGQMDRPSSMHGDKSQDALKFAREVAQHTEDMKEEMKQTNERLRQQLEQARTAQGEQQTTQLIEVIAGILEEHDTMLKHATKLNAMAIQHELKTANVDQSQIQQLEQQFAFLQENSSNTLRGIPQPEIEDSDLPKKPDMPKRPDSPTGPR